MENVVNGRVIIGGISIIDDMRCGVMKKWLYYIDQYYVHTDTLDTVGDLGYEANKADTRNSDSLEENIENLRYGAIGEVEEGWISLENEVKVWEIHKALFEDMFRVTENELACEDLEAYLNEYEWVDWGCDMVDDVEDEVVYTLVVGSKKDLTPKVFDVIKEYNPTINEIIYTEDIDKEEEDEE